MGKSTNKITIFNSYVNVYQRVYPINIPLNHYKIPLYKPLKIPCFPHGKIAINPWWLKPQRFFVGDLDYMHGRRTPEAVAW